VHKKLKYNKGLTTSTFKEPIRTR